MNYDSDVIVMGDPKLPGHDYLCAVCDEIFEMHYSRDDKPRYVICPVCNSGDTRKIIVAPSTRIWWKDPRSSSDVSGLTPKTLRSVRPSSRR